jgi:hypothetical protein
VISFSGCFAPLLTSNPPQQHKDDNDYQDHADDADTTVSIAVTVAAEAAAKPAQQKYDEDNYKNESYRHNLSSFRFAAALQNPWRAVRRARGQAKSILTTKIIQD